MQIYEGRIEESVFMAMYSQTIKRKSLEDLDQLERLQINVRFIIVSLTEITYMEKSDKQEQKKNKFTDIKTFNVPFELVEIKENLSINTRAPSKPSKEQIINQAFEFHSKGNILEAAKF